MTVVVRRLDEVARIFDGPHATPVRREEGPYFLNISSLSDGLLDLEKSDHVSPDDFKVWTRRVVPRAGDLLFSYETRLGEAALMPAGLQACLGRRMALLRPVEELIDPRFLLYLYLSPVMQSLIKKNAVHGATVSRISLSTMGGWRLPVPSLPEQQAIADVLASLDEKIIANRATVRIADALSIAEMNGARSSSSELCTLGERALLVVRGSAPRYTDSHDGVIVLNQKCVRHGRVDLSPARRTQAGDIREERILRPWDCLVNSTGVGTLGRVARWTYDSAATVDSHVTIVRWDRQLVEPIVAGQVLASMESEVENLGEGSTGQTELSRVQLQGLRLRLPPRSLQGKLAERLIALSRLNDSLLVENDRLAKFRDVLLPHLIAGRLTVKAAEGVVSDAV